MSTSKCDKRKIGRPRKVEITAEVEALLRNSALTDQQIADQLMISRRTVIRMRSKLDITKKRGRPRGCEDEVIPRPRSYRKLYISDEALCAWCASVYTYVPHRPGRPARHVPQVPGLPVVHARLLRGQY